MIAHHLAAQRAWSRAYAREWVQRCKWGNACEATNRFADSEREVETLLSSKLVAWVLAQPWQSLRAKRARSLMDGVKGLHVEAGITAADLAHAACLGSEDASIQCLVGRAYAERGIYDAAQQCFERAVVLDGSNAPALIDLGTISRLKGHLELAERYYRRALDVDPAASQGHYNLALLLLHRCAWQDALQHLRRAHAADRSQEQILKLLVTTLVSCDEFEEAVSIAQAAVTANASSFEALLCLGLCMQKINRPVEALAWLDKASRFRDDDAELLHYRALTLQDLGRVPEAFGCYDRAISLKPDFLLPRFHRALAYLLTGNYVAGWPDYELRLLSKDVPLRAAAHPRWDGADLRGRSILVYSEQGMGDQILFASCVPDLIASGVRCVIECAPKLQKLFKRSFTGTTIREPRADGDDLDERIDFEVPIGSLPMYYRPSIDAFPRHTGYLKADPDRVAVWKEKLAVLGSGLKVGISWRGGTLKTRGPVRSIDLAQFAPVFAVPGVLFVNLQYTDGADAEIAALPGDQRCKIFSWEDALMDYEETAALTAALDLTLSVSTSLVDLAGSLGCPIWIMAPVTPEWRYGHMGDAMAWYPSARVFRQQHWDSWTEVIEDVSARLHDLSRLSATAAT